MAGLVFIYISLCWKKNVVVELMAVVGSESN